MKSNLTRNIVVLAACWLLTTGMGIYVTFVRQPAELDRVERSEKVARLKQAEVASLLAESAASEEKAEAAVRKWRARYKVLPDSLSGPAVIGYLSDLTGHGFKNFDVALDGVQRTPDYSYYQFAIVGRGFFASLYAFIWEIENNRNLYRIHDLQLDHIDLFTKDRDSEVERMQVMVSFKMRLDAYFGGTDGMSAPVLQLAGLPGGEGASPAERLPEVPDHVLPDERPAINPFFPLVMEELPPNTHGLVDVEAAELVAIVGDKAVFSDEKGHRSVGVGGAVYLGQIVEIDPKEGRVVARLNKGGIIDEVEQNVNTGEHYRQALGPVRLAPTID